MALEYNMDPTTTEIEEEVLWIKERVGGSRRIGGYL
jgi:hypothetical protein